MDVLKYTFPYSSIGNPQLATSKLSAQLRESSVNPDGYRDRVTAFANGIPGEYIYPRPATGNN